MCLRSSNHVLIWKKLNTYINISMGSQSDVGEVSIRITSLPGTGLADQGHVDVGSLERKPVWA